MAYYRCNFLTSEGKVFCAEDVDGDTDDHALEKVRRICAGLEHTPSFELWRGDFLVYSEVGKGKSSLRSAVIDGERACDATFFTRGGSRPSRF